MFWNSNEDKKKKSGELSAEQKKEVEKMFEFEMNDEFKYLFTPNMKLSQMLINIFLEMKKSKNNEICLKLSEKSTRLMFIGKMLDKFEEGDYVVIKEMPKYMITMEDTEILLSKTLKEDSEE